MSFAPTVGQIKTQVRQKLRLAIADEAMVLYWMNQAYQDVSQYAGFWISDVTVPFDGLDGSRVTLPVEVEQVKQVQRRYATGPDSRPAQLVRMEQLLAKLNVDSTPCAQSGSGGMYAMSGEIQNEIRLWPPTSASESIVITHTVAPPELVDDSETLQISEPFGSKIVEYGALVEGAKFKKDPLIYDFENTLALWNDRYIAWLNRRKTANSRAFEVWAGDTPVDRLEAESEH